MSSMMVKFIDNVVGKYGSRIISTERTIMNGEKYLTRLGGETSKGMKWLKYYDYETGKLVAYEQSYKGKSKMVVYDLLDNPVNVVKLPQNGVVKRSVVSREEPYERYYLLDYLHELTENIRKRFGSVNKEMCTGHSWFN